MVLNALLITVVVILGLWSAVWKAIALWMAARAGHKGVQGIKYGI